MVSLGVVMLKVGLTQMAAGSRSLPPGFVAARSHQLPKLHSLASRRRLVFSAESFEGDGLNKRRLALGKISIGEVLISRTLSVYGEVAERLKAAVC